MTGAQGPMTDFYHYTCGHSAPLILQSGVVKPLGQLTNLAGRMPPDRHWMLAIAWFTNLDVPHREALGLTSETLRCDRTEWRITVADPSGLLPWPRYARGRVPTGQRDDLERYGRPAHWWVSEVPVRVSGGCLTRTGAIEAGVTGHLVSVGESEPVQLSTLLAPYRTVPGGAAESDEAAKATRLNTPYAGRKWSEGW